MIKRIHIGSNNKLSIEKEFRFEVVCPIEKVKDVIVSLRKTHFVIIGLALFIFIAIITPSISYNYSQEIDGVLFCLCQFNYNPRAFFASLSASSLYLSPE